MPVFFCDADYRAYTRVLARQAARRKVAIWAYCLMPNHVHLIVTPADKPGMSRALGEAHRLHAVRVNRRLEWTGHLWQERFASFPMDEPHLLAAIRYVLMNPVRAGLVSAATDWPFSSARAHVLDSPDELVNVEPAAQRVPDWFSFLAEEADPAELQNLRRHSSLGRPLGSDRFVARLERELGRSLRPLAAGRKRKGQGRVPE